MNENPSLSNTGQPNHDDHRPSSVVHRPSSISHRPSSTSHRPILVTGAHRSGTTWIGKMLATSSRVAYISEPLNVWHRPGVLRIPIKHWYTYINELNEDLYLDGLTETIEFKYHTWSELKSLRSGVDILRMGRDWSTFTGGALGDKIPLLKDPFAVFSAPWFSRRLDCQVVISVRHPAAYASSLKRLDWPFDFKDLLEQPLLMQDWLEPFRADMESMLNNPGDLIGQSCLLWRMVYQVVAKFQELYRNFIMVRNEDLSTNPVSGYSQLFKTLDLEFTEPVKEHIMRSSDPSNPSELPSKSVHSTNLDSRTSLLNWKQRLSSGEISRIRETTRDVWPLYYTDQEWE